MAEKLFFIIESGKPLELVKHHIAERQRVAAANRDLIGDLQVNEYWTSRDDGTLCALSFKGAAHPDFTKPSKRESWPKKGTEWARKFEAQKGYENPAYMITDAFKVPLAIAYGTEGGDGWRRIGTPFDECGFLWLSYEGPYAMWIPDVPAEVKRDLASGRTVSEPALSFIPEFEGCRRIEKEEWDILVAQHNLAKKLAQRASEAIS